MKITQNIEDDTIEALVSGRLDTVTAPEAELILRGMADQCNQLILNLEDVSYISSAGLRVVLLLLKIMTAAGKKMSVKKPSEFCRQVFAATGMDGILTIVS
ncbi:STAS domain-containing protein [Treponema sp.]|uniref:STAS domain-containing protein n=1 Tax=Treponema sp. TaxID=166 RepID=UPI0025F82DCF|nr:STAS domain-containing protein [Treponema sp.]MCR5218106.1 STAS domain-containing protein [Treponema sp.]